MRDDPRRLVALTLVLFPVTAWLVVAHHYWRISGIKSYWYLAQATPSQTSLIVAPAVGLAIAVALVVMTFAGSRGSFAGAPYRKLLRGPHLISGPALARKTRERGRNQVMVSGIPMPTKAEAQHLLLVGATGVGKSSFLRELAWPAMKRGDRMVIVDPDGAMYERFGMPRDTILNPYDSRTPGWSIYNEIRSDYDFERYARSLIPLGTSAQQEEWNGYARGFIATISRKLSAGERTSINDLIETATSVDTKALKAFLEGTARESLFSEGLEKMLGSIRGIVAHNLEPHAKMKAGDFSIRDWLDTGEGNIYITWKDSMLESIRPLNGAWIDVLCSSILDIPERDAKPLWLFLGELGSMGKLASLVDALSKGRKHGLRVVAELQSIAQIRALYGEHDADTLLANFRSSAIFASSTLDSKTREAMSLAIGEHEVERSKESSSRGRNSSTSTTTERTKERIVSASEIALLKDLTGYVTFPGGFPTALAKLKPRTFTVRNQAFVDA